ncbi:alpha/beta hydrolase [Hydrogenophaga sp. OTU3427]|uniref:alpha/beta hydrolase n=1 Tax=Hydrogenophaga sp. OTU3427 TaxID=3043856 RepID=UPI00313C32D4
MTTSSLFTASPRLSTYSGHRVATTHMESAADAQPAQTISLPQPPAAAPGALGTREVSASVRKAATGASCKAYRFRVATTATPSGTMELFAEMATQHEIHEDSTLILLMAGGSNNGTYWDWPLDPARHSFVKHATGAGFVTLNLDRPGYGKSDRPDPTLMDFRCQADAIRQVVVQLKSGAIGHKFKRVIVNGHSMGGMVAWHTAVHPTPIDAVIVSGVGHGLSDMAMDAVRHALQPVEEHPSFGLGSGLEPGYFIKRLSPDVPTSAHDLYTTLFQDTVMLAELQAIKPDSENLAITRGIRVPVLFALGRRDLRWCTTTGDCATDPVYVDEPENYTEGTDVSAFIVPEAGHLINKDPGAPFFFEKVIAWMQLRGF